MSSHQMNSNLRPYLGTETCPVVCCYSWQGWKWIANCNNLAILCQQKSSQNYHRSCSLMTFNLYGSILCMGQQDMNQPKNIVLRF